MQIDTTGLDRNFICVEYPGVVKNSEKAIETLGGISKISNTFCQKKGRLELRFRPDDEFCKPACSNRVETLKLVLKVTVLTRKSDQQKTYLCEVIGKSTCTYKFRSMCDFQFLPIARDSSGHNVDISNCFLPHEVHGDHLKKWLDSPMDYFLPPPCFSRVDTLRKSYMYRKGQSDGEEVDLIGRTRKRRTGQAIFVSFDTEKVPTRPRETALKQLNIKLLDCEHTKLKGYFDERPIWSKQALVNKSGYSHDQLKVLLPTVAFYYITGPFRTLWCRFGYDPKIDPSSRKYQALDFRIRAPPGLMELVKNKRPYTKLRNNLSEVKNIVLCKEELNQLSDSDDDEPDDKESFMFKPGCIPQARQTFYQYCDIKAPEIETMLERLPNIHIMTEKVCDPKTGWLPPGFDDQCRAILNRYVNDQLAKAAEAPVEDS